MAGRKERPAIVRGVRPDGKTPPELMGDEERREFAYNESVIAAKAIGAKPSKSEKREAAI